MVHSERGTPRPLNPKSRMRDFARPDLWGAWAGNRPGLPDTHQIDERLSATVPAAIRARAKRTAARGEIGTRGA